jgi:serine/threonine-protein kinase
LAATLRAAIVPSTARHTLLLMAVLAVPIVVITGFGAVPIAADRALREVTDLPHRIAIASVAAVWWAFATSVCAVISHVMYSLRREVSEARRLGQYTLEEKLGEGGMGVVYRARHALLRRPTAVKLLATGGADPAQVARFEREVQATAELTHPNTITVYDFGVTPDGVFYYAMELLDGASLYDVVAAGGPLEPARVRRVLTMVASALAEAHDRGLVHRDIKPSNVFLCTQGGEHDVAKVLDFGLVKETAVDPTGATRADAALTQEGTITGTPLYMAPEQICGDGNLDGRVDLYSLGAVGYYLLTGTEVFTGPTSLAVLARHLESTPEPPSARLGRPLPADLEAAVLWCLEKSPDDRPRDARALVARLAACAAAGEWTEAEARAWWELHRPTLGVRRAAPSPSLAAAATLAAS